MTKYHFSTCIVYSVFIFERYINVKCPDFSLIRNRLMLFPISSLCVTLISLFPKFVHLHHPFMVSDYHSVSQLYCTRFIFLQARHFIATLHFANITITILNTDRAMRHNERGNIKKCIISRCYADAINIILC